MIKVGKLHLNGKLGKNGNDLLLVMLCQGPATRTCWNICVKSVF